MITQREENNRKITRKYIRATKRIRAEQKREERTAALLQIAVLAAVTTILLLKAL